MAKATLINSVGKKVVVESGSSDAQNYFGQGYQVMGASGLYTPPAPTQTSSVGSSGLTPINPSITTTTPVNSAGELVNPTAQDVSSFNNQYTTVKPPAGSVAINGAQYNTRELQQGAFTNIQPVGNTLYGIPKAPIVPDIIPQKDLVSTMTPEKLSTQGEQAKGLVKFDDKQISDLNKANQRLVSGTGSELDKKNVDYAKSKGWQPTSTEEPAPISNAGTPTPQKSTADQIFEAMSNLSTLRNEAKAEAMKDTALMAKGEAIAISQTLVNRLRTDLQNQGILDIKAQDLRRDQPILTSQIQANLNQLSREQKLDTMILQNNYNNALVEQQIAEGNYDRAVEIVKETADDAYDVAKDQIDALVFKNEIETKAAEKLTTQLEEERDLAKEGYVQIKSPEGLKGLTEDKIYRDPVNGNIYMKPKPEVASTMEIGGITYGFDKQGNKIATYGKTEKPKTGSGGSGGGVTPTGDISKNNAKQIETALASRVGSDGYLSPEDYNGAKQEWVAAGGTQAGFDTKFKARRNPANKFYNIEGKKTDEVVNNPEEITKLKEQGYSQEELKTAGYNANEVDNAYKSDKGFLSKAVDWLTFWK